MAAIDVVNRVFREFRRYTGDGLPGAPVNAPLPVGDPQSGPHSPKKSEIRAAMLAPLDEMSDEADRAKEEADRAQDNADAAAAFAGFRDFSDTPTLLANSSLSYGAGVGQVQVGDTIRTRREGFSYRVIAEGASDQHVQTAGGVKLYVLPTPTGWPVVAFGVVADGVTDDYPALQKAHDVVRSRGGGVLILPEGTIFLSQAFRVFDNASSYYSLNPTVGIIGQGVETVFTRGHSLSTDIVNIDDEADCLSGAAVAWFASNGFMDGVRFEDCKVGFYMGQNPAQALNDGAPTTNITMNRFSRFWFKNCCVGHIGFAPLNLYYNSFEDMHVSQCRFGWVMDWMSGSPYDGSAANYNRNHFRNVRLNRNWCGMWIKSGGTNVFHALHAEGQSGSPPSNNRFQSPQGLPGGLTRVAVVTGPMAIGNDFTDSIFEANDFEIYNEGQHNSFTGDIDTTLCTWRRAPKWLNVPEEHLWTHEGSGGINAGLALAAPRQITYSSASARPMVIPTATSYLRSDRGHILEMQNLKTRYRFVSYGALASGGSTVRDIQDGTASDDFMSDSSGVLDCTLIGHNGAGSTTHVKCFKIAYQRNGSRTVVRAFIFDAVDARATGINAGDAAEPFALGVQVGSDTRVMRLNVVAPARAFEVVELYIREVMTKDKDVIYS